MAEWNPTDIGTVVGAARTVAATLGARFRSLVPGSTYVGTFTDFLLNTNADAYQTRKDVEVIKADVAAIRKKLGA